MKITKNEKFTLYSIGLLMIGYGAGLASQGLLGFL